MKLLKQDACLACKQTLTQPASRCLLACTEEKASDLNARRLCDRSAETRETESCSISFGISLWRAGRCASSDNGVTESTGLFRRTRSVGAG